MKRATDPDVILLQAAADPTRLAILRELSSDGFVCACDFTSCCDVAQPTVSHHLKVLREAGWIVGERRGPFGRTRFGCELTRIDPHHQDMIARLADTEVEPDIVPPRTPATLPPDQLAA